MKSVTANRVYYLDVLRILATIAIVGIHVTGMQWLAVNIYSDDWDVYNVGRTVCRWGVPVFIMISGAIFLNRQKISLRQLYGKNLKRIVVSLFFWYFIFLLITVGFSPNIIQENPLNHIGHLWFLFLIGAIYILYPLIINLYNLHRGALLLLLVIGFIVPTVLKTIPYLFGISILNVHEELVLKIVKNITGWPLYFMLGGIIGKMEIKGTYRNIAIIAFALASISSAIIYKWYVIEHGRMVMEFYGNLTITVLVESVSIFIIIKSIVHDISNPIIAGMIIKLSKLTFGIYLTHMLFLPTIDKWCMANGMSSLFTITIDWVMSLLLSLILSGILNKSSFLRKYII